MSDAAISSFIKDPELRMIAETHELDTWVWGTENQLLAAAMMEGAAIAIRQIYDECKNVLTLCWIESVQGDEQFEAYRHQAKNS
jgi:hypothetical protein